LESLVQPTHVFVAVSQAGLPPVQRVELVDVHCTHVSVAVSHAGVGYAQFVSLKHATQIPADTLQ
jgi:hypothetical protein